MKNAKYFLFLVFVVFILLVGVASVSATSDNNSTTKNVAVKKIDTTKKVDNTKLSKNKIVTTKKNNQTSKKAASNSKTVSNYKQLVSAVKEASAYKDSNSYTINMKKGNYKVTERVTFGLWDYSQSKVKTFTVNGNGAVIDGQNSKMFMNVFSKYTVNINDLTIKNTKTVNPANGGDDAASAINAYEHANINVKNCKFISNTGGEKGGAISHRGVATIKNCTFYGNTAYWGPAIYAKGLSGGVKTTISDCTFEKHTVANYLNGYSNDRQAVVYLCDGGSASITNNLFKNNNGRCIHVFKVATTISNNEFKNNQIVDTRGGSIVDSRIIRGGIIDSYESAVTMTKNKFYASNIQKAGTSSGVNGGVLYHEIGNIKILDNLFANVASANSIKENGGSLYIRNANAVISYNTFTNSFTGSHVRGGSVYTNIAPSVTLEENIFKNTVRSPDSIGGSVYSDGGKLTLVENTFNAKVNGGKNTYNSFYNLNSGNTKILHKQATKISLSSVKGYIGSKVTLKAIVKNSNGVKLNVGKVEFYVNNVLKGTKKVSNGAAKLSYKIPTNSKAKNTIVAKFLSTDKYKKSEKSSTLTAKKRSAKIGFSLSKKIFDNFKLLKVKAYAKNSGKKIKEGKMIVKVNGKTIKDSKGKTIQYNLKSGIINAKYRVSPNTAVKTYKVTVEYKGTKVYKVAKSTTKKIKM